MFSCIHPKKEAAIMPDLAPIPPQNLRFAVIGLGRMGLNHVEAGLSVGMQLVGGADVSPEACAAFCEKYDLPAGAAFTDGAEMLKALSPDALVVATTAPTHAEFVQEAAKAGVKYILCEKPLALSVTQADDMIAACAAAGVRLGVNHQMRFMEQYTAVKELVTSQALGGLSSILVAGSNFGLAMNASHYFEMFRYMTDQPVTDICAWFEDGKLSNPRGAQFDDASGRVLARNGAGVSMFMDFSAHSGWGMQVTYICRNGQIIVDEISGEMKIVARQEEYRPLPTTRYGMPVDTTHRQIAPVDVVSPTAAVWTALLAGDDWPNGADGAHALRCLVAAHASHRKGGAAVALDAPDLPVDECFGWA